MSAGTSPFFVSRNLGGPAFRPVPPFPAVSFCPVPVYLFPVPFTYRLISGLYALLINPRSREPRRGVFVLLYYGIGAFTAGFVVNMVLLCLEAYNLPYARDFLYARLGTPLLAALEAALF